MGELLRRIRTQMGYVSARSFFLFLQTKAELGFNYSYYMKIEGDQVVPSAKVVNQIAAFLPGGFGDLLVQGYCKSLFPGHAHLFAETEVVAPETPKKPVKKAKRASGSGAPFHQVELNERQVAVLAADEKAYFLFSLVTLSRHALEVEAVGKRFDFGNLQAVIEKLKDAKLVALDKEGLLIPAYPEFRFPAAETDSLKRAYARLDEFDKNKIVFFGLKRVRYGEFFRRISPKYIELIDQNLDLIFQMIRMSDETDVIHNTKVVSLSVTLHDGTIPG